MTTQPSKMRAAALGGLALGAASATPFINFLNCACCSLVVLGGVLATYLYLKDMAPSPQPPWGDVALVGMLAGMIGAAVSSLLSLPFMMMGMGGGMWNALQEAFSDANMPPELQNLFATLGSGTLAFGFVFLSFVINLFVYALFATLGALLGAALLHRKPTAVAPVSSQKDAG